MLRVQFNAKMLKFDLTTIVYIDFSKAFDVVSHNKPMIFFELSSNTHTRGHRYKLTKTYQCSC